MRGFSLSKLKQVRFNRIHFGSSIAILFSLFLASACTNINNSGVPSGAIVAASSTGGIATASASPSFVLSQLAPDPDSPGAVLDFIGQNSQFDTYCGVGGSGGYGTCYCQYTFTNSGSTTAQTVDTPITYEESNLVKCANSVPSGTTSFTAQIIVLPGTGISTTASPTATPTGSPVAGILYASNTLTGTFTNGALSGTSYIDLTNASTYVQVQRFQCRKREYIDNPLNIGMVDPFQTQNPAVIYPFNFYTTNVASSLLNQQHSSDQSWECSLNGNQNNSLPWWANANVFSASACTDSFCVGDGSMIYPQNALTSGPIPVTVTTVNGKRRSSFALASSAYGVFSVAVQAAIAPSTYTAGTYATIGYAAAPIAGSNGTSSCPNITLPAHASWVKLWNFQATNITSAVKVTASTSASSSVISCDSTHTGDTANYANEIFPSCEIADTNSGATNGEVFGIPLSNASVTPAITSPPTAPTKLASRVISSTSSTSTSATSACMNFEATGSGHGYSQNDLSAIPWTNSSTYNGNEVWIPGPYKFDYTIDLPTLSGFPWNSYVNDASFTAVPSGTPANQWLCGNSHGF
jgi:hypothetical protein